MSDRLPRKKAFGTIPRNKHQATSVLPHIVLNLHLSPIDVERACVSGGGYGGMAYACSGGVVDISYPFDPFCVSPCLRLRLIETATGGRRVGGQGSDVSP